MCLSYRYKHLKGKKQSLFSKKKQSPSDVKYYRALLWNYRRVIVKLKKTIK